MNYSYQGYQSPFARNYQMPNYNQPQYVQQQVQQPMMQQQPIAQQQLQQVQTPIQYEMPIQYVGNATFKEAEAYILMPNSRAFFIDRANGMIYEKTANNDGQSFISEFKKVEPKTETKKAENFTKEEKPFNVAEFATKTDLKEFVTVEQYKELKDMLEGFKGQINGLKQGGKTKVEKALNKEIE